MIAIFESGAILLYLAEKTGRFGGGDPRGRTAVNQWLVWIVPYEALGQRLGDFPNQKRWFGSIAARPAAIAASEGQGGPLNQRADGGGGEEDAVRADCRGSAGGLRHSLEQRSFKNRSEPIGSTAPPFVGVATLAIGTARYLSGL